MTVRPPGAGRKARARRRREAQSRGDSHLLRAPFLHGNTAPGRLRVLDDALRLMSSPLFRPFDDDENGGDDAGGRDGEATTRRFHRSMVRRRGIAVDVGVGDDPSTTLELASNALDPDFCNLLVGTDVDENRVNRAIERADFDAAPESAVVVPLEFRLVSPGFCLVPDDVLGFDNEKDGSDQLSGDYGEDEQRHRPQPSPGPPLLFVRAMNVLRDYHVRDAVAALHEWRGQLHDGGWLVEGSADAEGSVCVALVLISPGGNIGGCQCDGVEAMGDHTTGSTGAVREGKNAEPIGVDAVVFAADLAALDRRFGQCGSSPSSAGENWGEGASPLSSPAGWFIPCLPRIWRGCRSDCIKGADREVQTSAAMPWADPMRDLLLTWSNVDADNISLEQTPSKYFLRSVRALASAWDGDGVLVADWADRGVLVWRLEGSSKRCLRIPHLWETMVSGND